MSDMLHRIDHLTEQVHKGFFYHGTSLSNARKIMKEGLKPGGGSGWGTASVYQKTLDKLYLTGSLGKAARYALKFEVPVILGIAITGASRLAKMNIDPADHWSAKYDGDYGDLSHDNPLRWFGHELDKFGKKRRWGKAVFTGYKGLLPDPDEFWSREYKLREFNLYRATKSWLRKEYDRNKANNEYREFLKAFRPDNYDGIHILDNGSIRFDSSFWETQHQLEYPDEIPAAAIKEVWVPLRFAPGTPRETQSTVTEPLPGEQRHVVDLAIETAQEVDKILHSTMYPDVAGDIEVAMETIKDAGITLEPELGMEAVEAFLELMEPMMDYLEYGDIDNDETRYAIDNVIWGAQEALDDPDFLAKTVRFGLIDPEDLKKIKT